MMASLKICWVRKNSGREIIKRTTVIIIIITEIRCFLEPAAECLIRKLSRYSAEVAEIDTNIVHNPPWEEDKQYVPYVGNGYIGVTLYEESLISVKPQVSFFEISYQ